MMAPSRDVWRWWITDPVLREHVQTLERERRRLRKAISRAYEALEGGDHPPDSTTAQMWLRTTFASDHPNYVDPASLR